MMMNTASTDRTVVALFNDMGAAQDAVRQLEAAGISRSDVSIIAGNESGKYKEYSGDSGSVGKSVAGGAGAGAAIGGGLGLAAGLAALAIPGFGPVIAAGPIAAALTGAGIGAAAGGLIGGLTKAGISEEDAQYYAEGVRRGGVLVTVKTREDLADRAADILDAAGAEDVDERAAEWKQSGWSAPGIATGKTVPAKPITTADRKKTTAGAKDEQSLPVVQEELRVGKRAVERGGVRVYTHVHETPVEESVELRDETVRVDRRPVNRPASEGDLSSFKEGTIELTETDEEAVVEKRAMVVEEVVVSKDVQQRTEKIRDTVRRTDVEVENLGSRDYDTDYRADFETRYAGRGRTYDSYAPAYRFGSTWASDKQYQGRNWSDVEPDLRRDWESRGHGTWADFKDAIRHGWDKVSGRR